MGFDGEDRKKVARGTLFNVLGGASLAASKAFQFVLRRLFGGPAFGLYAITYGVMELCANFLLGGFGDALTYHLSQHLHAPKNTEEERLARDRGLYAALASGLRTPVLIALALAVAIWFGAGWLHSVLWSVQDREIVHLLRVVIWALPLLTVVHLLAETTRAHLDMRLPVLVVQTLFPLLSIGFALFLHWHFHWGIVCMAYGLVGSLLCCLPVVIWGFSRYYSLGRTLLAIVRGDGDPEIRRFAIPQCLNMASNLGLVKLDSLMLSIWVNADAVGIYVLLTELTQLVRLPKMAFSGVFGPLVAKYQRQGNRAGIAESLASLAQITAFIGILTLVPVHLFYPEFILGQGKSWVFPLGIIWLLSVGPLMSIHFGLAGNLLLMTGHSRLLLLNSLGSLALNALLDLLLIPIWGVSGAAIATAVSNLLISSLQIYEMGRLERFHFSWHLYHRTTIFLLLVGVILVLIQGHSLHLRFAVWGLAWLGLAASALWIPGPQRHPLWGFAEKLRQTSR
ncbi:MAG TPA: polysaccharide biosynthesis C-terminal domain-containing protein [Fibrobacteraceae bacterium]|nr:polysaccharide biosynthesis C-terminal domain-containing protein [Fibrobacteraceae bacterium]